jgi:purine nucleoside permease
MAAFLLAVSPAADVAEEHDLNAAQKDQNREYYGRYAQRFQKRPDFVSRWATMRANRHWHGKTTVSGARCACGPKNFSALLIDLS